MGKRRLLTDIEIYYVQNNPENLSVEEMAIKLNCNVNILGELNSAKKENEKPVVETASAIKQNETTIAKPLSPTQEMIRNSFGRNKRYGSGIMTPQASQLIQDTKPPKTKSRYGDLHKPYGDQ